MILTRPLLTGPLERSLASACLGLLLAVLALLAPLTASAKPSAHPHSARRPSHSASRCLQPSRRGGGTACSRTAPAMKTHTPASSAAPAKKSVPVTSPPAMAPPVATPPVTTAPITTAPVSPTPPVSAPKGSPAPAEPEGGESPLEPSASLLPSDTGNVVGDPIDPHFLTDVPFGKRSFWIQPWRAYLDTLPASRLQEALGANFPTNPAQAKATARLLHDSGFTLARIGINWDAISYSEPSTFRSANLAGITTRLTAMRENGLRPLIVLDANSGAPAPLVHVKLETLTAAPAGAQTVTLSPASAALVVPGKTGFNALAFGGSPDILITSVGAHGVATLSRPLLHPLPSGTHGGTTLRYAPFQAPTLADGAPSPEFKATLAGWLSYVRAVSLLAASIVGPGGYDLEVWNELTFGSQFLNSEHYYSSTPAKAAEETSPEAEAEAEAEAESEAETEAGAEVEGEGEAGEGEAEESSEVQSSTTSPTATTATKRQVNKLIRKALLNETVAYIRDPANGISLSVGITNGFASQTPFPSGADAPPGLTALSKHPYTGPKSFPAAYRWPRELPVNAQGARDTSSKKTLTPLFVPTYQSLFPEYWLTATSTETLVRDLAPFTTEVYGFPHGREVAPAGQTAVQKWVTEFNLATWHGTVVGPDETTPQTGPSAQVTAADRAHFQAKVALRSLVSNVNKGITREYFFTAGPGNKSLLNPSFFSEVAAHPGSYPGDGAGGETTSALHTMLGLFQGPGPGAGARQLSLTSISQEGNHAQFTGDGTSAHPSLYDRDVLAVLPFQSSPTRFVIPVYVMTRDMLTLYEPGAPASDIHRFDLPSENFKITLSDLPETATAPSVSAYDPLRGEATPARLLSREGSSAVFEFAATDYPRILAIEYPSS
jgi:hypothetical protein